MTTPASPPGPAPTAGWTALIASRMPSAAAQRVRIHRQLRQAGAIAVRDGVYALPDAPESRAALARAGRELARHSASARPCVLAWLDPGDERACQEHYARARDRKQRTTRAHIERLERVLQGSTRVSAAARRTAGARLARLRKHLERSAQLQRPASPVPGRATQPGPAGVATQAGSQSPYRNRVWVTRRGVLVDRIASAWLIRRFVDPDAGFRFVGAGEQASTGELRFDLPGAEFTHQGDRCTFETLVAQFRPEDPALGPLAEIIHDLDIKDGKFGRPEAAGVGSIIAGLASIEPDDAARLTQGRALFDSLYAALGPGPPPQLPKGVLP